MINENVLYNRAFIRAIKDGYEIDVASQLADNAVYLMRQRDNKINKDNK